MGNARLLGLEDFYFFTFLLQAPELQYFQVTLRNNNIEEIIILKNDNGLGYKTETIMDKMVKV